MKVRVMNGIPRLTFITTEINNGVRIFKEINFPSRPITLFNDLLMILRRNLLKATQMATLKQEFIFHI